MTGRVIVVTGAFGSLGRAVVSLAVESGARVALIDVTSPAPSVDSESVACFPGVDLQQPEAAAKVMDDIAGRFGDIHALANIAGGFRWETVAGGETATWDGLFRQNLTTALHASRAAVSHLLKSGSGAIVNVGAAGALKAGMGMGAYAASKSAVHRLTEAMAEEFKSAGLRVNAVLPSIIDTPTNRADMPAVDFEAWVKPADLARVILFLLSDDARAITGALLPVAGRV